VARTAVVAGTATAVSNRVSRRQANRWSSQEEQQYYADQGRQAEQAQYAAPPPQQVYAAPAPAVAAAPAAPASLDENAINQLKELAELKEQGILTEDEFQQQKARILG